MAFIYSHPITTALALTLLAYSIGAAAIYLTPAVPLTDTTTDSGLAKDARSAREDNADG